MGHKKRKGNSRDSTSASWEVLYKPSTNMNCWCFKGKRKLSHRDEASLPRIPVHLLKMMFFFCWHRWFLEEPFTSMESFQSTKGSLIEGKMFFGLLKWHLFPRIVHWNVLWRTKNDFCIAVKTPFIFKSEALVNRIFYLLVSVWRALKRFWCSHWCVCMKFWGVWT